MNGLLILTKHLQMWHKEHLIRLKGGSGSGGWGHDGRQGKHGGSQAGSGGLKKIGVTPRAGIARRKKLAKKVSTTKRITRTLKPKVEKKPTSKVKPVEKKKPVPAKKVPSKKPKVEPVEEKKPLAKSKASEVRAELVGMTKGYAEHNRQVNKKQDDLNASLTDLYQRDETLTEKVEQGKISSKKADVERQSIQKGFAKAQSNVDSIEEMKANAPGTPILSKQRELLYAKEGPAKFAVKGTSSIDTKKLQDGFDEFAKIIGKGTSLEGFEIHIEDAKGGRAGTDGKRVYLNNDTPTRTVIHEMAHVLEISAMGTPDSVLNRAEGFLQRRTKGEESQKMKDLMGNPNYDDSEIAKPDKFKHPYTGAIYKVQGKTTSTEVMSMGVERMWKEPAQFAKDDPDFFDFIYDTLEGARTHNQ